MGRFDLKTFLELQGQGGGTFTSIGTAFGMPSCMLNLGNDILSLLPAPILEAMSAQSDEARLKAQELVSESLKLLLLRTGIAEYDTETGLIRFGSDSSEAGLDSDSGGLLNDLGSFLGAVGAVGAVGGQLYRNYQTTVAQIDGIKDCIGSYEKILDYQNANAAEKKQELAVSDPDAYNRLVEAEYGRYKRQLERAKTVISQIDSLRNAIEQELLKRYKNPELEPEFSEDYYDYVKNSRLRFVNPNLDPDETDDEIIRLVYGPPKVTTGQLVLSLDGLYYDSQSVSGIQPVLAFINTKKDELISSEKWKFLHNPNVGGKGEQISLNSFNTWVNNIFDINIIDESLELQRFYKQDHFLQVLIGQKEKRILDVSAHISELEATESSTALITNFKESLVSEVAYHDNKINRRKKQIEIAVKAPSLFGKQSQFVPGLVPINDFSFLQDCNISLELSKQKQLVLDQEEVSGVVLPLKPTFVASKDLNSNHFLEHLYVPEVGIGSIIVDGTVSSLSGATISLTDVVTTDKLFAIYNYLESKIVSPSSTEYQTNNCATQNVYNNAQLAAKASSNVFPLGLAIPYLQGICLNNQNTPSAIGSYVKLPSTKEFQDWTYGIDGFSFETWLYTPNLDDQSYWGATDTSSFYRLVLACENTGSNRNVESSEDILLATPNYSSDYTRGLVCGFTSDRRWTQNMDPSQNPDDNNPSDDFGFIIAPTQAMGASSIAFLAKREAECGVRSNWHGMYVSWSATTETGLMLADCSGGFHQLNISCDYKKDTISVFLDAELLESSSISTVFGTRPKEPIKIPSLKHTNSFEYSASSTNNTTITDLHGGPKLYDFFTPWILGGGYTDGMALNNNFMGGDYGGTSSGLLGYLGSTKFYSKALNIEEVKTNYEIQSILFKNIAL